MTRKHVIPAVTAASFSCPTCGALAQQTWYQLLAEQLEGNKVPSLPAPDQAAVLGAAVTLLQSRPGVKVDVDAFRPASPFIGGSHALIPGAPRIDNLYLSQCFACREFAVWVGKRLIFPPAKHGVEPNADLPAEIVADYEEARSILELSPRGAAALLRLSVQKLCKALGESGKNIDADIASLVKKGLDVRVQKALDIVRVIGNRAVHPGEMDLRDDRATAIELFALINLIADRMITQSVRINEMYQGLPENKRKAIEQRDKPKS